MRSSKMRWPRNMTRVVCWSAKPSASSRPQDFSSCRFTKARPSLASPPSKPASFSSCECDALRLATPRLTEEHLVALRAILKELETAYERCAVSSWGRLNWELHRSLFSPAERVQHLAILQNVNPQTDRYIRLHLLLTRSIEQVENEHRALLRLWADRDTGRAVLYLKEHIHGTQRSQPVALKKTRCGESRA